MTNELNRYNQQSNMVLPLAVRNEVPVARPMTQAESAALQSITSARIERPQRAVIAEQEKVHAASIKHADSSMTVAKSSAFYALCYAGASGFVMVFLSSYVGSTAGGTFVFSGLTFGIVLVVALIFNRQQGLYHSATGLAHHEIKADVSKHSRQMDVEEHAIDADTTVRLAEIDARVEAVRIFTKVLEAKQHD